MARPSKHDLRQMDHYSFRRQEGSKRGFITQKSISSPSIPDGSMVLPPTRVRSRQLKQRGPSGSPRVPSKIDGFAEARSEFNRLAEHISQKYGAKMVKNLSGWKTKWNEGEAADGWRYTYSNFPAPSLDVYNISQSGRIILYGRVEYSVTAVNSAMNLGAKDEESGPYIRHYHMPAYHSQRASLDRRLKPLKKKWEAALVNLAHNIVLLAAEGAVTRKMNQMMESFLGGAKLKSTKSACVWNL